MLELPTQCRAIEAPEGLSIGREWTIDGVNAERVRYRGVRPGEAFTVRDATGAWFRARLHRTAAADAWIGEVFEPVTCPESPVELALLQAVPGRERIFWVLQKATELGASWILPVFTERSLGPAELAGEKVHRWPAAILRAVAQCRRGCVPALLPPLPLSGALHHPVWHEAAVRWALVGPLPPSPLPTGEGGENAGEVVPSLPSPVGRGEGGGGALLVGPEGGWSEAEIAMIRASGAAPVSLGGRILRTETAAVAGLTLLQHLYGDLQL